MPDIGFSELLLIGIVALIVIGPKDLPGMFRTVGRFVGKARGMAREFQRSMEAAADETGLKEATNTLKGVGDIAGGPKKAASNFAKDFLKEDEAKPKPTAEADAPKGSAAEPDAAPKPVDPAKGGAAAAETKT